MGLSRRNLDVEKYSVLTYPWEVGDKSKDPKRFSFHILIVCALTKVAGFYPTNRFTY